VHQAGNQPRFSEEVAVSTLEQNIATLPLYLPTWRRVTGQI